MQINFTGRNIDLTADLKNFTTEKMQRIQHRDNHITKVDVIFHKEKLDHIAEARLHLNGTEIHATAEGEDIKSAVDILVDKLVTQITKQKEKHSGHR